MPKVKIIYSLVAVLLALPGCTDVGYRCPLDASKTPDEPTACAGMHAALYGSQHGTGDKNSVLMDGQGRLLPQGYTSHQPAKVLDASAVAHAEPYRDASGEPLYEPGKKFQVWTRAFVDADGNLHDGHQAWFATPDKWSYGTTKSDPAGQDGLMRPAISSGRPATATPPAAPAQQPKPAPGANPAQAGDKTALQNLSATAAGIGKPKVGPDMGMGTVVPPAFTLGNN